MFTNKKKGSAVLNNDVADGDGGKQSEFTYKRKYLNSWGKFSINRKYSYSNMHSP